MLAKILKLLIDKKSSWKIIFIVITAMIIFWVIRNYNTPIAKKEAAIFREGKLKPIEYGFKDTLSTYEKFMNEKKYGTDRTYGFDPRVKIIEGGGHPLRMLYKDKKAEIKEEKATPSEVKTILKNRDKTEKKRSLKEKDWSQSAVNLENVQEYNFFKAVFRDTQAVYNGKPLRIVLLEDIPELSLESGTILKGPATFLEMGRIRIHITAAEGSRKKIALDCFDSEDLQEGIYHDELAKQIEEYTKEGMMDELLDIEFRGKRLAKKAHDLTRIAKKINIEAGKEVFVALPPEKPKLNE